MYSTSPASRRLASAPAVPVTVPPGVFQHPVKRWTLVVLVIFVATVSFSAVPVSAQMEAEKGPLTHDDYDAWKRISTDQIEDAGQQELLNWMCLAGAMQELGRKPKILDYVESYVFNSNKCLALFTP